MAFTPTSPDALETAQLGYYSNRFPDKAVTSEDFLGKLARAEAQGLSSAQLKMLRVSLDAIPNASSLFTALADWATAIGLSDGAGGYGPLGATVATGGTVTATGTNGSTITNGTVLASPTGAILYAVTGGPYTISGGVATVSASATTPGAAGNLANPTQLRFVSPPAGVQSLATIASPFTGGTDLESAAHLLARIQDRLRNPPHTGTAANLAQAAEGVSGVSRAYVYPRRLGTGTFDVYLAQSGTGSGRRVTDATVIANVEAALLLLTVTTERVTVGTPTASSGHAIRLRAVPVSQYPFDWDSSAGTWTVSGYDGTAKTVTVNTAVPADFQAATNPRIQVKTTGVVLPVECTITSISGSNLVLHFTTKPTEWVTSPPQVGDEVHAGADFVAPIAAAILALVDGLGPSLASGYADTATDAWGDILDVFQIGRVAMDVTDTAGLRYLSTLVTDPTIDGATTAVEATDAISTPPQFLIASSILVTP
jgi:hypothetical protein